MHYLCEDVCVYFSTASAHPCLLHAKENVGSGPCRARAALRLIPRKVHSLWILAARRGAEDATSPGNIDIDKPNLQTPPTWTVVPALCLALLIPSRELFGNIERVLELDHRRYRVRAGGEPYEHDVLDVVRSAALLLAVVVDLRQGPRTATEM